MPETPTVAAKERARDLKQTLYDRTPSLCCQPNDDWLNTILQAASQEWGENIDATLLQAIVDFGSNADQAEVKAHEAGDEFARTRFQDLAFRLRTIRDALEGMRADLRATPQIEPTGLH